MLPEKDPTYQLLVKTHRLTVVIGVPVSTELHKVKEEILSALNQFEDDEPDVPKVSSTGDFEICRRNNTTQKYELVPTAGESGNKTVKEVGLKAWERLFLRFRDGSGLSDVQVELPPLVEDE